MHFKRRPTSPGEILHEEFLKPIGLTQKELAHHIGCDIKGINRLINGRANLTATMAIKLAAAFNTTPDFWLNAQKAVDIHKAQKAMAKLPKSLLKAA